MKVIYSPLFRRMFRKLTIEQKMRVDRAIDLFIEDPFHPLLHNHKLKASKRGLESISAGYDLRIVYFKEGGYRIVTMVQVGTHDEVY